MSKNEKFIAIILIGGIIILRLMKGKNLNNKEFVFKAVAKKFGVPIARSVEKIFRMETGHFKKGFEGVYGAGMHPAKDSFPYGWTSLRDFWVDNPSYRPVGITYLTEGKGLSGTGGGQKAYLKFPSFMAGAMTVAKRMQVTGNNPGAWYSHDKSRQQAYNNRLLNIPSTIVNNVT